MKEKKSINQVSVWDFNAFNELSASGLVGEQSCSNEAPVGKVGGEKAIKPEKTSIFAGNGIFNPPPTDARCMCCGRHISELKPYGGPGDPLVGDFTGAYLVRIFRPLRPYDEKAEQAYKEAYENCENKDFDAVEKWLIKKYGEKEAEEIIDAVTAENPVGKSWECRDCVALDTLKYFKKYNNS